MTKEEIDILWNKALRQSVDDGSLYTRYRFAELVAEAEREACAKVADSISEDQWALYKGRPPYTGQELERASDYTQGKSDGAEVCAAAIRARGETK